MPYSFKMAAKQMPRDRLTCSRVADAARGSPPMGKECVMDAMASTPKQEQMADKALFPV